MTLIIVYIQPDTLEYTYITLVLLDVLLYNLNKVRINKIK